MNAELFDAFARKFAAAGEQVGTRRAMLRALGLGGAVMVSGPTFAGATSEPDLGPIRGRFQTSASNEIEDLAFQLEYDIDKIFAYVRDEVIYDPYPGVLRGALGTLWGLAGNSADQAVLLAALLNAAKVRTRFVIGELIEEADSRLEASLRPNESAVRAWAERVFAPLPEDGEPAELTADEEPLLALLTAAQERFQEVVDLQAQEGIATVLGALEDAGIVLPEPKQTLADQERTQHVWVQVANGTEWLDLDPSIPNAEMGTIYATETATLDQLPEEFFHRISMRLVAEKVLGGVPAREELLKFEATSAELVGVPITLMHPDAEALKAIGVAIQEAIGGYRNFIPALIVGNQSVAGQPVTFVTGEGVLGAFGDVSIEGDTLGEWLEIDVRTPGLERQIVREVFDRVGYARRGEAPVDPTEIPPAVLIDTGGGTRGYPPLAGVWSIGVVSGAVPSGYFRTEEISDDPLVALSRAVHTYHHVLDALTHDRAELSGQRYFIDAPNVTAVVQTSFSSTAGGQAETVLMDLIHRHGAALPVDGVAPVTHPLVAAGVFGHAVERALVEATGVEMLGLPSADFISVGRVFEEANRQGIPIVIMQPGADDPSRLAVDEIARQRIAAALSEGYVVITPERAVTVGSVARSGWWLVDPHTGTTLDQLDNGRGATLIDYAFTLARVLICAAAAFHALGLVSLIRTYGAGNELQAQWTRSRVKKLSIAGGLCAGSFAV